MEIRLFPLYFDDDDINELANDAWQLRLFDDDQSTWYVYADRAVSEWFDETYGRQIWDYTNCNDIEKLVEEVARRAKMLLEGRE